MALRQCVQFDRSGMHPVRLNLVRWIEDGMTGPGVRVFVYDVAAALRGYVFHDISTDERTCVGTTLRGAPTGTCVRDSELFYQMLLPVSPWPWLSDFLASSLLTLFSNIAINASKVVSSGTPVACDHSHQHHHVSPGRGDRRRVRVTPERPRQGETLIHHVVHL